MQARDANIGAEVYNAELREQGEIVVRDQATLDGLLDGRVRVWYPALEGERWESLADLMTRADMIGEDPDTCLNTVDGHWYVVTYGRAPYSIHAADCSTCAPGS